MPVKSRRIYPFLLVSMLFICLLQSTAADTKPGQINELLSDRVDVDIIHFAAQGDYLLLWIAPDYGFRKGQQEMAGLLASRGLETWLVDLNETLFLPRGSNTMRQLPGRYVSELITRAYQRTGKKVILVSSFYGSIPLLKGAREWQLTDPKAPALLGAILFSPALYSRVPALGKDPEYLPIADATNIPVMIFQGEANGSRWQLNTLLGKLHAAGSQAYSSIMPGISSIFYPEERSRELEVYFQSLPARIMQVIKLFEQARFPQNAVDMVEVEQKSTTLDIELKPYKGDVRTKSIQLKSVDDKQYLLNDYKGKVTLINFWATWCPPCVEEIPSLNRLQEAMNDENFNMISVNYVEDPQTIKKFIKQIEVNFPVLLDRSGEVTRDWKVIVFPSTFVVGPDGDIIYGVNAAINWDSDQTIQQLKNLLPPKP